MSTFTFERSRLSVAICSVLFSATSYAADFTITGFTSSGQSLSTGETGIINNGGTIFLGSGGPMVDMQGDNMSLTNDGTLYSIGYGGVTVDGANNTILNDQNGVMTVYYSNAIDVAGFNNEVVNDGRIEFLEAGISEGGYGTTIVNNGTITTDYNGNQHHGWAGVESFGINASITNNGRMEIHTNNAVSIDSSGANADIVNNGFITMAGDRATGIYSTGTNASINNTGAITVPQISSYGIRATRRNAHIVNTGLITASGDSSYGIHAIGDRTVIDNSGFILATGANSLAIAGEDGTDTTVHIRSGSFIQGAIDLGGYSDNDTLNIYGVNTHLVHRNVENVNLLGAGVVTANRVVSVDAAVESSSSLALASKTASVHGVAQQRMAAKTKAMEPVMLASLTLSPSMLFQEREPVLWTQFFGGSFSHDATSSSSAYDSNHYGAVLGYEQDSDETRTGFMVGMMNSVTDSKNSFENTTNSFYGGAYRKVKLGWINVSSSVLAGYSVNENEREIGSETAKAEFNSVFISPAVNVSAIYDLTDSIEITPSAGLKYNMAWLDEYQESGSSADLSVDNRQLRTLTTELQLATAYKWSEDSKVSLALGLSSRHTNDEDINASVDGHQFSYSSTSNDSVTTPFAGVDVSMSVLDNVDIAFGLVAGGNNDESYTNGHFDIEYQF